MTNLSDGTIDFEHVTLTVTFDLHLENFVCHTFGLLITFFTFRGGAFIFGMCVPYDNTFPMVLYILST